MTNEFKRELTIEELEEQYKKVETEQKVLRGQIEKKKKEEKELKEAKLNAEKEARKKEVDEAIEHCTKLLKDYMHDYGIYSIKSDDTNDIFNSKFWNWIW